MSPSSTEDTTPISPADSLLVLLAPIDDTEIRAALATPMMRRKLRRGDVKGLAIDTDWLKTKRESTGAQTPRIDRLLEKIYRRLHVPVAQPDRATDS